MNKIIVFDIDGVLVDSSHRYRNLPDGTIDLAYWLENNTPEQIAKDKLLPLSITYRNAISHPDYYVIIATARQAGDADFEYIREKLGFPQHMIYRKPGDHRPDWLLKLSALRKLLNLRQFWMTPIIVFEDNPTTAEKLEEELPMCSCRLIPSWNCPLNL